MLTLAGTSKDYKNNTVLDIKVSSNEVQTINLENCARKYTGGYVVKKCVEKFKCLECRRLLCSEQNTDAADTLILEKNYYNNLERNSLYVPSKLTTQVFSTCLILIRQNYKRLWAGHAVLENLEDIVIQSINKKHSQ